jgi:ABC-type transporter Mla subunit MlaD
MNRQGLVGLFTILALLGLFFIFFELTNIGTAGRYKTAVHFKSASGIHKGALVYESGVNVGVVDEIRLMPDDFTVDVILAINNNVDIPKDARFIIQAPLTGDSTLEIVPKVAQPRPEGIAAPTPAPGAIAILPHEILPLEQQPLGTNPATLTDLLEQGQGEVQRLDTLLADLEQREPQLLNTFQSALTNANDIAITTNQQVQRLAKELDAMQGTIGVALGTGVHNVLDITETLDKATHRDSAKLDGLLSQLDIMTTSLNETLDHVKDLAGDPRIKQNLIDTTKGIAQTATTIAQLTTDLRQVTGNPHTQAQLRDTVANIDAVTQKTNSLLGSLGAKSSVYGLDPGATPPPVPVVISPAVVPPPVPGSSAAPVTVNVLPVTAGSAPTTAVNVRERLAEAARNLLSIQIRLGELDRATTGSSSSPLLTGDRGPQTDVGVTFLPHGKTSLITSFNDIGSGNGSFTFAGMESLGGGFRAGGGVLYSRLGLTGGYTTRGGGFGLDASIYDPRHPTLDGYGTLKTGAHISVFGGERDILHSGRRTVFGLQFHF